MTTTPAVAPLSAEQLDNLLAEASQALKDHTYVLAEPDKQIALIAQARAARPATPACSGCDPAEGFCRFCRDAERTRRAGAAAPSHETIVSEGSELVCTACGTTATPQSQVATYTAGIDLPGSAAPLAEKWVIYYDNLNREPYASRFMSPWTFYESEDAAADQIAKWNRAEHYKPVKVFIYAALAQQAAAPNSPEFEGIKSAPAAQAVEARALFEAKYAAASSWLPSFIRNGDYYQHRDIQNAWHGWQMASDAISEGWGITAAPAPAQEAAHADLLGPQRWSKEAEMMESWQAAQAQQAAAPARDAEDAAEPPSQRQEKLRALADRIDHEKLWKRPMMYRDQLTDDQRNRLDAGVSLRRYANLLAPGRWLILPPAGNLQFSADSLDKAVEVAKDHQSRAMSSSQKGES